MTGHLRVASRINNDLVKRAESIVTIVTAINLSTSVTFSPNRSDDVIGALSVMQFSTSRNMQDQDKLERWDGIVTAWLAECAEIDPEVTSIRDVIRPFALVISSNSAVRQTSQLRLTAAGYQTLTARDLNLGLQKASERSWAMIAIGEELIDDDALNFFRSYITPNCEIHILKALEAIAW
jgi:hypothetical protein